MAFNVLAWAIEMGIGGRNIVFDNSYNAHNASAVADAVDEGASEPAITTLMSPRGSWGCLNAGDHRKSSAVMPPQLSSPCCNTGTMSTRSTGMFDRIVGATAQPATNVRDTAQ
ncbi:uncharacterized protein SCHCODRAFT_02641112 [Schizophyllum commune H4-8]|uniref:uncharacterized protein n=1 Tax=Schizophyllum commune (strain H4-8 / FGSC 9210) TaxID=578458 RepID=UPI002160F2B2|nr:uncharacterized protein SCHCODRAFT_02641112 [Schizophyllum commune H4-8]KAI5887251.1 hypothetical protein SCHCODRAFT_02641112 [Schizophyllum commune H4-8]